MAAGGGPVQKIYGRKAAIAREEALRQQEIHKELEPGASGIPRPPPRRRSSSFDGGVDNYVQPMTPEPVEFQLSASASQRDEDEWLTIREPYMDHNWLSVKPGRPRPRTRAFRRFGPYYKNIYPIMMTSKTHNWGEIRDHMFVAYARYHEQSNGLQKSVDLHQHTCTCEETGRIRRNREVLLVSFENRESK